MGIFRRKPARRSGIAPSGHPGDDQLLMQIAQQSELSAGRHWIHYLYFAGEEAAHAAAAQISDAGWGIRRVDQSAGGGPEWIVIADMHGAVITPETVGSARSFFEAVAAAHLGGDYDGWEASL